MKFPISYTNGNYKVTIHEDGTKERFTKDNEFVPVKPETIDVNISNYCTNGCEYCYIDATEKGKHGNLFHPIFSTLEKGTEVAINYAEHPDLYGFLCQMYTQGVIVNMTINSIDLNKFSMVTEHIGNSSYSLREFSTLNRINNWIREGLIKGIGVSTSTVVSDDYYLPYSDNIVLHVINGVQTNHQLRMLSKRFEKVLVLGYKQKGRAKESTFNNWSEDTVKMLFDRFKVISFDNLALEQLNIKNIVPKDTWNRCFMGEEGQFSLYIDTVEEKFYKSSTETEGKALKNKNIKEIFNEVCNS